MTQRWSWIFSVGFHPAYVLASSKSPLVAWHPKHSEPDFRVKTIIVVLKDVTTSCQLQNQAMSYIRLQHTWFLQGRWWEGLPFSWGGHHPHRPKKPKRYTSLIQMQILTGKMWKNYTFLRQRRPCSSPSASPTHKNMNAGVSAMACTNQTMSKWPDSH